MTPVQREEIESLLEAEVTDDLQEIGRTATCSALQAYVSIGGETVLDFATGRTRLDEGGHPVDATTRFDLASLTKPLVTCTLLMQAVVAEKADWQDPLAEYLGDWPGDGERGRITLLQLLNHTSGLPDWRPLYEDWQLPATAASARAARGECVERIAAIPLEAAPGGRECYSDLGYMLLAAALEKIYGNDLADLARRRVFDWLDMEHTGFAAVGSPGHPVAAAPATEVDPARGGSEDGVVAGTVHDRNCAALGGVSGHAGVFGTARDVGRFAHRLLHLFRIDGRRRVPTRLLTRSVVDFCWSPDAGGPGHHRGCWDTPSGEKSSAGRGLAAGRTVGHLGFTGTSLWIERDRRLVAVLLTNRTYPDRDNERIGPLRIDFHEALVPPPGASDGPAPRS